MTKAEIIRKTAKQIGIGDSEAKIFFEIFLKKSAEILSPGESLFIPGIGYFQLRKAKLKTSQITDKESLIDIIVHSSEKSSAEKTIFNIPASKETYNYVDSLFSLSIGKPVIPIKGVKSSEFFIPPSGHEFRRIIESKADNLISKAEVDSEFKPGEDYMIIDKFMLNPNQIEINWEDDKRPPVKDDQIPWDFGFDIDKAIEEESILDTGKEEPSGLSWDFGLTGGQITPENIDDSQDLIEAIEDEKSKIDASSKNIQLISDKEFSEEVNSDQQKAEKPNQTRFERVVSLTSEIGVTKEETEEWDFGKRTAADTKLITKEGPKGFTEVKLKTDTGFFFSEELFKDIDEEDYEEIELPPVDTEKNYQEERSDLLENQSFTESEIDEHYDEDLEFAMNEEPSLENTYSGEGRFAQNKSAPTFIVIGSMLIFILIGYLVIAYFTSGNDEGENIASTSAAAPVIIERDYSLAVNYPYQKNELNGNDENPEIADEIKNNLKPLENNLVEELPEETDSQISSEKKVEKTIPQTAAVEKIQPESNEDLSGGLIGRRGNEYSVQVSSWKNKEIAESEVAKYSGRGLKAFIEEADIPGRGKWYRVRIGGFSNLEEARNFLTRR